MALRKALATLAAASLVIGGTAMAAPAAAPEREATPVAGERLGNWTWFLAVIVLIGVLGVALANTDEPASP